MRSSLLLAAVAVVTAGVEATAISSNTTSVLLPSTTRRRGCGRLSSSGASPSVSVDAPDATSAAALSTLSLTTDTVSPGKTLATAASTPIDNTSSTITSTESSTEASETVSATISGTESSTEASPLVSLSLSTTDPNTIKPTGIVLPTLITTDSTSESSTTTVPTIISTESTTDTATLDSSTVSVTDFSTGTSTEITSSMTEASTTVVSESSATDSTSSSTTATSTTTMAPTCSPTSTVNGDFEASTPNWTFTGDGGIQRNGDDNFDTPFGNFYARLNGFVGTTSVMSQAVANVAPSATLSVSYRLAGSWSGAASCTLTATYANIVLGAMTLDATSAAAMNWQTTSWPGFDVPGSGTLAVSWGQCSGSNSNVALDNVYLTSNCLGNSAEPTVRRERIESY
ncbi:hypothetical protein G7054_g1647 [Neopestalotiopsis clavispora]|nr:hypothetical protein G7054_g1647 [Neopestalotiopsis clavispora]